MCKRRDVRYITILMLGLLVLLVLNSCNFPARRKPTEAPVGYIYTAAAQTVQVQLTQVSQPPATDAFPSDTPPAQPSPSPLEATDSPTSSPSRTPSPSKECNIGDFIRDVNVPDDTRFAPGEVFEKTWRLKNAGTCDWTPEYAVVFTGENLLNAPASVQLTTETVEPGETVDVTIKLDAPAEEGTYRQNFKLADETGDQFGMGSDGTKPFWAQIKVGEESGIVYDFLAMAPQADWKSGEGETLDTDLPFGGNDEDPDGVAKFKESVTLENGSLSGKLLLTYPKHTPDGVIAGFFPEYEIKEGDRLIARLGFMAEEGGNCGQGRVVFQIAYRDGETIYSLGEWRKTCDSSLMPVNINLGGLQGKTVEFLLLVVADGPFEDDWAVWNSPRIEH